MLIKYLIGLLFATYLFGAVLLYVLQREMLYAPTPKYSSDLKELTFNVNGETLKVLELNSGKDKALIYFGGNSEPVVFNEIPFSETFANHTVYLVNYRGYGGSTGTPTQDGLLADSLAIYDNLITNHDSIGVIGRSLGSGVASYLASQRSIESLLLITPYDSIEAVAKSRFPIYPVSLMLKDKYDSLSRAPSISAKVLIIAAEMDSIIPLQHSENLYAAFDSTQVSMVVIEGANHNNLASRPEYYQTLRSFIETM
ncbi:MAG: alpha/beta hydrolase [Acidiferrobacterales bacterium]|nr:alpha/beta hydrolase [Acidiferrobacterales bacterium]